MLKKHTVLILTVLVFWFNTPSIHAASVSGYYLEYGYGVFNSPDRGTDLYAMKPDNNGNWGFYNIRSFNSNGELLSDKNTARGSVEWQGFTCNGRAVVTFYSTDGTRMYQEEFQKTQIISEPQDVCYPNSGTPTEEEQNSCISCDLFNCPNWTEYMGKVDEIIQAIPPAPDWEQVAGTFKDTIVPALVSDMSAMLGEAPDPPPEPIMLPAPDLPVIELPDLQEPTMNDNQELEDAGFTADDIKNEAEPIEYVEDDGEGFVINDPEEGLDDRINDLSQNVPSEPVIDDVPDPVEPEINMDDAPKPNEPQLDTPTPNDTTEAMPTPTTTPTDDVGDIPTPNSDMSDPIPEGGSIPDSNYKTSPNQ